VIQVLVDADNVSAPRLRAFLRAVPLDEVEMVVAGHPAAVGAVTWPRSAALHQVQGWQQADLVLVEAYRRGDHPLVLVSGDGDFAMLAGTHPGPVLVISDRPASRLRAAGTVVDPVVDGLNPVRHWFDAVLDSPMDPTR
jgi:hypothetical protein